jgi:hypothetical protein
MFNYASRRRFVKIVNLMGLLQALFSGDGLQGGDISGLLALPASFGGIITISAAF